jgi:hypothetical protein
MRGEDGRVATVLPMLHWVSAAQCVPRAGRPQTETTGPKRKQPPECLYRNGGDSAAEVLCLYAAPVDR